jgi:hypothetical protein
MAFLRGVAFGLGLIGACAVVAWAVKDESTAGVYAVLGLFLLICGWANWMSNR